MKSKNFLLLLFIMCQFAVYAQNQDLDLIRVEFWQPQAGSDQWIKLKVDGTGGDNISEGNKTKAWVLNQNGSVSKKPVAYVSGSKPRISACFKKSGDVVSCSGANGLPSGNGNDFFGQAIIEGLDQTGAIVFSSALPIMPLVKAGTNDTYEYNANSTELGFEAEKIQFFGTFRIKWKWSREDKVNGTWFDAGISENSLYVTLNKPVAEEPGKHYFHFYTLIHIGCKYADKAMSESSLISNVWDYFSGRQVSRADGTPLKYYGQWSNGMLATNTEELLSKKDGMCTSWAKFLLDVLKVQGFREEDNLTNVQGSHNSTGTGGRGFFVKTWTETPPGTSGDASYPYRNEKGNPFYINNAYNWQYKEVSLTNATAAQNNNNPQSDFGNHVFTRIQGQFYDPSYGVVYGSPVMGTMPDPMDPTQNIDVETVPVLDNGAISAYYYSMIDNPAKYFVQMNQTPASPFIYVVPPVLPEMDDY